MPFILGCLSFPPTGKPLSFTLSNFGVPQNKELGQNNFSLSLGDLILFHNFKYHLTMTVPNFISKLYLSFGLSSHLFNWLCATSIWVYHRHLRHNCLNGIIVFHPPLTPVALVLSNGANNQPPGCSCQESRSSPATHPLPL